MSTIQLALNDVACTGCIGKIKKKMKKYHGVEKVTVVPGSGTIQVIYNETIIHQDEIQSTIHKLALRIFD
ncbi:cation transporter [Neobacillus niacini]|uniref:cation transporter n=1 Tax=Neobacillus niacini TaxID=86668 RepID=UPI0028649C89|nr:cation transporter [Neobacillus niacini]MDR7002455.1 copper chaperone CopZ [Neobacillus niacini]